MAALSKMTKSLWAKKSSFKGKLSWLPLFIHMEDSVSVAKRLWAAWLSQGVRETICAGVGGEEKARQLVLLLAATHDLGKATPVFQATRTRPPCFDLDDQIEEGLKAEGVAIVQSKCFSSKKTPHALAGQVLLEEKGCNRNAASIVGAHHGKPVGRGVLDQCTIASYGYNYHLGSEGKAGWQKMQQELLDYALALSDFPSLRDVPSPSMTLQVLLSGLLIMTDWIASNEGYFPYLPLGDSPDSIDLARRGARAWKSLDLTRSWQITVVPDRNTLFRERFPFENPNSLQEAVTDLALNMEEPGILVIEASMGKGKTEAALACAEIFAAKTGRGGVYFALPTQATSDGIFSRLCRWINRLNEDGLYSIQLAHGKAQFNTEFQSLKGLEGSTLVGYDEDSSLVVHEWFEGSKRSMLADFVVGTIDQLLLAALRHKHVMLRHLGLSQKVVIIDECHAYDAYMSQYLHRALQWLGAYGVPVIILSATLPAEKRRSVVEAYLNRSEERQGLVDCFGEPITSKDTEPDWVVTREYPLITYSDRGEIHQRTIPQSLEETEVKLGFLSEEQALCQLEDLLSEGGCAGVLCNTVRRAQEFAHVLRKHFGDHVVHLIHSRFLAPHRIKKEEQLLRELGKPDSDTKRPEKRIVVGTQVMEQSLDIDFDVLLTDIAPMDLLIQRIGRLHRHERTRPDKLRNGQCFILGCEDNEFEEGAKAIYGEYLLMRTRALLGDTLRLPQDIPTLVQKTYEDGQIVSLQTEAYFKAKKNHEEEIERKAARARNFRIDKVWLDSEQNLLGWLDTDMTQRQGEASVRDTDESIEVLLVRENDKGEICLLDNNDSIAEQCKPSVALGMLLARQRIRLPSPLCAPWIMDKTISELEEMTLNRLGAWQDNPWLKGELVLILDKDLCGSLAGWRLRYSFQEGLHYEKEDSR